MLDLQEMNITGESIPPEALMLLGFQRTRQISPESRLAWEDGNPAPLQAEVRHRGTDIFRGALEEVFTEYRPLRAALTQAGRTPRQVMDIGCGQALNDAFLVKDFDPEITLVDIEETPEQYHAWNRSGSGYASLAAAKAFLEENGARKVTAINPRHDPEALATLTPDLATSLISCGFHYPIGEYADLFHRIIANGGAVVLDLRKRYLRNPDPALVKLAEETRHTPIPGYERKARRIMFHA